MPKQMPMTLMELLRLSVTRSRMKSMRRRIQGRGSYAEDAVGKRDQIYIRWSQRHDGRRSHERGETLQTDYCFDSL